MDSLYLQGRVILPEQLDWIRSLISTRPEWGRSRLSLAIAQGWEWRNSAGQLKDMAARTLLLKLERRGLVSLPARKAGGESRKSSPPGPAPTDLFPQPQIHTALQTLLPLRWTVVNSALDRRFLRELLSTHHYLGYRRAVGENLQYLVWDAQGRPLAALVFGAAAWKCAPRDRFIGWDSRARQAHLHQVANNMRFLIMPWVQVKHLASHLLASAARRLNADWQHKYGHRIYLLETFVQRDRFAGTCYRAANWICVGQTQGRSRNDVARTLQVPPKDVYVYPLDPRFDTLLQKEEA